MTTTPTPTSLAQELDQLTTVFTAALNAVSASIGVNGADTAFVPLGLAQNFVAGLTHPAMKEAARAAISGAVITPAAAAAPVHPSILSHLMHPTAAAPVPTPAPAPAPASAPVAPAAPAPVAATPAPATPVAGVTAPASVPTPMAAPAVAQAAAPTA